MASGLPLPETKALLAQLISFDTTSAKSNLPLISFVRDYLTGHGVNSTLVPNETGEKASLFATIGAGDRGIGLSAHSDCVPVEGQNWSSDPFTLTERDGKLFGRGTCDMKGFAACVLAMVPRFKDRREERPIHIVLSYDEEVGCAGVRPLIAKLGQDLPTPEAIIVGEPSGMRVVDAHKGIDAFVTDVRGREAHSSMPHLGVNAISVAAQLIGELARIGDALAQADTDERFDPPYSTLSVGTIKGGTAGNIVPRDCTFRWQVRSLPGLRSGEETMRQLQAFAGGLLPGMQAVATDAAIDIRHRNAVPAFRAADGSGAVALALKLTGENATSAVSYGTEAGLFEQAGCDSVICGPGDVAQAHAADEFVSIDQLERCLGFLDRLAGER
jgi:acetylornithine deacetylase